MIGLIFGKFAPFHMGHAYLIQEAMKQCTTLLVVVSYDQKFNDSLPDVLKGRMTLDKRIKHIQEYVNENIVGHVRVTYVDETHLAPYPYGWPHYQQMIKDKSMEHFAFHPDIIFSSEDRYDEKLKEYFPNTRHVVIDNDRTNVNISATEIRNDIYGNWEYLPYSVRKDYTFKVCVIGTESCGKTTLCQKLAEHFNTDFVPEFGRIYVEQNLDGNELDLIYEDYSLIANTHKFMIDEQCNKGEMITIIDTNALITGFYQLLYEGSIDPIVEDYIKKESYDLVLYLDDDVPWVDDGMRMSGDDREYTKKLLWDLILQYGVNPTIINGNYEERYDRALDIINQNIGEK